MHFPHYLGLLHQAQLALARAFEDVGRGHAEEADLAHLCPTLARQCDRHAQRLQPFVERYGETTPDPREPKLFQGTRPGPLGMLRDLQDLYLMAAECDIAWTLVGQAAQGLRDEALLATVRDCESETALQLKWLRTRMKEAAPQTLVVAGR